MSQLSSSSLTYQEQNRFIERALRCLENRFRYSSDRLNNSKDVASFLQLQLAEEKNEVFGAIFLNNQHCFLGFEKLFYGTINESTVYPRRVMQKALEHNAAAIIVAHNHPSGYCHPSQADEEMTQSLKKALSLFDIKLLDHIIVSHTNTFSFAENSLL